jgi:hypothetical protein
LREKFYERLEGVAAGLGLGSVRSLAQSELLSSSPPPHLQALFASAAQWGFVYDVPMPLARVLAGLARGLETRDCDLEEFVRLLDPSWFEPPMPILAEWAAG